MLASKQGGLDEFGAGRPETMADIIRFAKANRRRLEEGNASVLSTEEDHHDECDECHRRITITSSGKELGHRRGAEQGEAERCSRRPEGVDPTKPSGEPGGGR